MQAEGKDRHEIQHALMPFSLPMNYREKTKEQEIYNEYSKGREITISVLKFNPRSKVSKPHFR